MSSRTYGGTTLVCNSMSSRSSSSQNSRDTSRDGTPDSFGDRMTSNTDKRRVPVEHQASGAIDQKIRVNSKGQIVVVENHFCRTK